MKDLSGVVIIEAGIPTLYNVTVELGELVGSGGITQEE